MKIVVVIGARPQFIKHAPFELACNNKIELVTIHTGQHYDKNMSEVFFDQLGMSKPKYLLKSGGGGHGEQTGKMLQEIEPILLLENPDYVLVYGDTNSTLAGALAASKIHIPIIHIEAGLRSFNKKMPEEVNRILTDHVSDYLFISTDAALQNLKNEGVSIDKIHSVGDIMVDAVRLAEKMFDKDSSPRNYPYYFVTVHRPYNTDDEKRLRELFSVLNNLDEKVIFPMHPRTKNLSLEYGINLTMFKNIEFCEPLSYFDNIHFLTHAKHSITDSGGLQKEAYIVKTPCITVRSETEWSETLVGGWNILCFENLKLLPKLLNREIGIYNENVYGKGDTSEVIVDTLLNG